MMGESKPVVVPILMPQVGNTMEEGTILGWKVSEGDVVEAGDILFEVETDKAAVEVEAVSSGRLARIVLHEGDIVPVLQPVAYLAESDSDVDEYLARQSKRPAPADQPETTRPEAPPAAVAPSSQKAPDESGRVKASPAARKLADQSDIDLASAGPGSGPGGRILSSDVLQAPSPATKGKRRAMTSMRRAIAGALERSKQTIPHFTIERTIDAEPLRTFCKSRKDDHPCTINDVIVFACGRAVAEFPEFRSQLEGDEIVELPSAHIGVAVQTEDGLMVPVVKEVEKRSLEESAAETRRVVEAARGGKLIGVGESVFTVSNLGVLGIERFSAIINPPESAILAVGAAREEVIVSGGVMRPGWRLTLTLSCDHRLIDGVLAAKFLNRLKELLEDPESLT